MKKKGQTSFELIFILSVIIILSVSIMSSFNSIKNSTAAMAIAKANTLKALNISEKNFVINKILIDQKTSPIKIKITTIPQSGILCQDINARGTKELIENNGLLKNVKIVLNENYNC